MDIIVGTKSPSDKFGFGAIEYVKLLFTVFQSITSTSVTSKPTF
jgi:hypothetical protein